MERLIWADVDEWCDVHFGPVCVRKRDQKMHRKYACRRKKGHDGGHDCLAAVKDNYTERSKEASTTVNATRIRRRSAAARAVFK